MDPQRAAQRAAPIGLFVGLFVVLAVAILTLPVGAQVGLLAGAAGTAFFFARPQLALLFVFVGRVVVDLLWRLPFSVGGLNIKEAFGGGVTALGFVLLLLELRRVDRHPSLPPFVVYLGVLAVGAARNLEIRAAAEIAAKYVSPLLVLFLIPAFFTTRASRDRFLRWGLAVFFVPVALALYHYADGQMATYVRDGYHRLLGGYEHPHNHALFMVIVAAVALWWWFQEHTPRAKVLPTVLLLGSTFALYNTYVRTGQLALVVFVGTFLLLTGRRQYVAAGLVVAVVFIAVTPAMQDRFKDVVLLLFPDDDVIARHKLGSGRMGIWTASIASYLDASPADVVFGHGIGKHWLLTLGAYNPYKLASDFSRDAHSDYLSMTFQIGPIATAAYLLMQVQVVWAAWQVRAHAATRRQREYGSFVVALMVGATVANMVSNSFINRVTQSWMLWAFSGLAFAEYFTLVEEGRIPHAVSMLERMRRRLRRRARR